MSGWRADWIRQTHKAPRDSEIIKRAALHGCARGLRPRADPKDPRDSEIINEGSRDSKSSSEALSRVALDSSAQAAPKDSKSSTSARGVAGGMDWASPKALGTREIINEAASSRVRGLEPKAPRDSKSSQSGWRCHGCAWIGPTPKPLGTREIINALITGR
ncbi:hypothetical protein H0E87_031533, partial [Populus deltoides]